MNESTKDEIQYYYVAVSLIGLEGVFYWYIDESKTAKVNDFVWVTMGKHNRENLTRVGKVLNCTKSCAPYPIEKTKRILRLATEQETEMAEREWYWY